MAPHPFLRVLGTPELRSGSGEPIKFRTKKHFALLIFLAVEPRNPHRRDRLTELLWPDAPHSEGRHSLATALSVLRGKLGPRTFETTRDTVRLVAADLEVDLERLLRGEVLGDDVTPPLDVGGFLDDFEVTRAPEYMFWRDLTRARLLPRIRVALVQLMDRCRRSGDFTRIEGHADRLLGMDELNEDGIRAKMEARAFAGDRLSALRVFQAWRQRLADELGATPSPLVEGMALRLRQRGYEPPGTSHIPTVPTDQWRGRAFVGRGAQYRVLYERWEGTGKARGRHALLVGESGIGKTTLAERLVTAAGLEGAVSSRVQCYEVEREIPYNAIGTLVRGLLDRPGASATAPEWLAELARFVPAVAHRYPNLPPPKESAGESTRLRLTEAVHQLVTAVADEHPLILVVDDVHLADDVSVSVLHLLMRRAQSQRVMLILTARQGELTRAPHASRLLEQQEPLALALLDLPPLTDEEMNEMVTVLAGAANATVPAPVRRALLRASTGVPMLVELLFDDWVTHGDECLALAVGAMTTDALRHPTTKEVYQRLFDRMLGELSRPARAVLDLAAILGDRLTDLEMYELVDLTLAQTLSGMAELATHRVLRDGGREMEFRNELLRTIAYLSIPAPLRRALHGLIADRLLARDARGERIPGLTLAWHCFRAGRRNDAIPYLLRGSREAIDAGAPYDAEFALRTGMSNVDAPTRPAAILILSESMQEQGRWRDSLEPLRREEMPEGLLRRRKQALQFSAETASISDERTARDQLAVIEDMLRAEQDPSVAAHLLRSGERIVYLLTDRAGAQRLYVKGEQLWRQTSELANLTMLAGSMATLAWVGRRRDHLNALLPQVIALQAEGHKQNIHNYRVARLANIEGCLHTTTGNYQAAREAHTRAFELHQRRLDEATQSISATNIALCAGRLGDFQAQFTWATRAEALLQDPGDSLARLRIYYQLGLANVLLGRTPQSLDAAANAEKAMAGEARAWILQAAAIQLADLYLICGERKRALRTAADGLERIGAMPLSDAHAGAICRWVALVGEEHDRQEWANEVLDTVLGELHDHDALDQAEILAAKRFLSRRDPFQRDRLTRMLSITLSVLPEEVNHHLRRLEMLG